MFSLKDMWTGALERVSVSSTGEQGNAFSDMTAISDDGTVVAFMSEASNLVPDDTNETWDFFAHNLTTGETTRVNVSSSGKEGNLGSDCDCRVFKYPMVSANGRYVTFHIAASNLVPDDTNDMIDVFRHDLWTGETIRVSVSSNGEGGNYHSFHRDMSPDGRYVVFHSGSSNLVEGGTNDVRDIFIHDVETGITERESVSSDGVQGDQRSDSPRVSADGRFVAFASFSTNLVPDDTNWDWDVFVRDRKKGITKRISVSSFDEQGDSFSRHPAMSDDGRWIAFHSVTTNLVPGDTNGERDIFLRDMKLGETIRLTKTGDGLEGNGRSYDPNLSADGRFLVYDSLASNLVEGDNNDTRDIFRYDRSGDRLDLSEPIPGVPGQVNTWSLTGGNAGASVILVYSKSLGQSGLPGCAVRLDIKNAGWIRTTMVEAGGVAEFKMFVPDFVQGRRIFFQVYEPISCRKSDVVAVQF